MYAIYAYFDPPNHPNVGIYGSPMECLGDVPIRMFLGVGHDVQRSDRAVGRRWPWIGPLASDMSYNTLFSTSSRVSTPGFSSYDIDRNILAFAAFLLDDSRWWIHVFVQHASVT